MDRSSLKGLCSDSRRCLLRLTSLQIGVQKAHEFALIGEYGCASKIRSRILKLNLSQENDSIGLRQDSTSVRVGDLSRLKAIGHHDDDRSAHFRSADR